MPLKNSEIQMKIKIIEIYEKKCCFKLLFQEKSNNLHEFRGKHKITMLCLNSKKIYFHFENFNGESKMFEYNMFIVHCSMFNLFIAVDDVKIMNIK